MTESKYGKHIVTELKSPHSPEQATRYAQWATRILWMDDKVVDGAFQMNCAWYLRPPATPTPEASGSHTHDADEIIGFFGNNPEDPCIYGRLKCLGARAREMVFPRKLWGAGCAMKGVTLLEAVRRQ
jgi:hypothetical protein